MSPSYEVLQQQKRYKENINIQGMLVKKRKKTPRSIQMVILKRMQNHGKK